MAGKVTVEYSEADIRQLIIDDMNNKMPGVNIDKKNISIQVKSSQNYKSEWESANSRGTVVVLGALT